MSDQPSDVSVDDENPTRNSPVAVKVPDSNKKRAVDPDEIPNKPFRFLDLPDELRLKIYDCLLPSNQRLFLDIENVSFPSPHIVEAEEAYYEDVIAILLVCKKIHTEAIEYIYTNNMVNVIKPHHRHNFLADLGTLACSYITKLECHVKHGLGDLGFIWSTMEDCPKLDQVRLVFYHESSNWSKTLAQVAEYIWMSGKDDLELGIELHTSVHPRQPAAAGLYQDNFERHFALAIRQRNVYSFGIPKQLEKITITASVTTEAANEFATWTDHNHDAGEWIRKESIVDTAGMKTLFWKPHSLD